MKKIHMVAICGTGMGSLAGLLQEQGYRVTGSDANIYPPMSDQLRTAEIEILMGYRPENIRTTRPDLVIVGNAISKDNSEIQEVQAQKIPLLSMPETIEKLLLPGREPIVVAGTHGKTTTCGLLAWILHDAGRSPGFFVGGILKNFGRSYALGKGTSFVIEGDEYDSAFFDKGPKFLHYHPQTLILNAVEYDHADIYRDLDHLMGAFSRLIEGMPPSGLIIADGDNPNVRRLLEKAPCRTLTFGLIPGVDLLAESIRLEESTHFVLKRGGGEGCQFQSPLMGRHNIKNTLAAIAASAESGLPFPEIDRALRTFQGVKRRQEILAEVSGVTVIDDFAHHPTAVSETLAALRGRFPKGKIWAVFEPRSNTTRRNIFQKEFVLSFDSADEIILAAPYQPEKIPEDQRLNPERLVEDLQARGKKARTLPSVDRIVEVIGREASFGDILCLMSNGGFGGIYDKVIRRLQ